jgi:hypothetical protein
MYEYTYRINVFKIIFRHVYSISKWIPSRDKEGKAASGPDPNIRASDTTGLGVKWKWDRPSNCLHTCIHVCAYVC